jgi:hypothetical protein
VTLGGLQIQRTALSLSLYYIKKNSPGLIIAKGRSRRGLCGYVFFKGMRTLPSFPWLEIITTYIPHFGPALLHPLVDELLKE